MIPERQPASFRCRLEQVIQLRFDDIEPLTFAKGRSQLVDIEDARQITLVVLDDERDPVGVDAVQPQVVVEVPNAVVVAFDGIGLAVGQ